MKLLRPLALAALLAALVSPEVSAYRAERRIGMATAAFRGLLRGSMDSETASRVRELGDVALSTTGALVGDPRPWMLAGSAHLVTGNPERALELYREGFATGERAEIDLNIGRALALLKRTDAAGEAFVRAGWINPEILGALPAGSRAPAQAEVERLARELAQGRLPAPPSPPPPPTAATEKE